MEQPVIIDKNTRVYTETVNPDSIEIGRAGNRIKIYYDANNPETLRKKLENTKKVLQEAGLEPPDESTGKKSRVYKKYGKEEEFDEIQ